MKKRSWDKRIQELKELEDGWLDGDGKKPTKAAWDKFGKMCIFPTQDGGLSIEFAGDGPFIEIKPEGDLIGGVFLDE